VRGVRTYARTAGLVAMAALLAGCGIRSTQVPVDAGPAPSRASCAVPHPDSTPEPGTEPRSIYLVCGMQVTPVRRSVAAGAGPSELLAQLHRSPLAAESRADFSTEVPGSLAILRPWKGDPLGTLRLNQPLEELPSFALAQIVCTLTDPTPSLGTATPAHPVLLAGPTSTSKPRPYACTPDLRTRPDAADTAGIPLS
jgi:hypothetical protein